MKSRFNTIFALLIKSTKLLKAVKVLKALKPLKAMLTIGTMLLSVIVYGFAMGWKFSVGLVAMLLIHEFGHVVACRVRGIPASAPVFIPFLGAAIFIPKIDCRHTEAYVGIGGPVLGTLGAFACLGLYYNMPSHPPILALVAYLGIFINLFNLVPLSPLDGGRITQAVSPHFKTLGVVLLLWLTLATKDPGMLLIWILVIGDFNANPKKIFWLSVLLFVVMSAMQVSGVGPDYFWQRIADVFLGALFTFFYYVKAYVRSWDFEEEPVRPYPKNELRVKWLGAYAVMATVLIAAFELLKPIVHQITGK